MLHVRISGHQAKSNRRGSGNPSKSSQPSGVNGQFEGYWQEPQRFERDYSAMAAAANEEEFYTLEDEEDEDDLDEIHDRPRVGELPRFGGVRDSPDRDSLRSGPDRDTDESPSPFDESLLSRENSDQSQAPDIIQFFRTDTDEALLAKNKSEKEKEANEKAEREKQAEEKKKRGSGVLSFFGFGSEREKEKERIQREREEKEKLEIERAKEKEKERSMGSRRGSKKDNSTRPRSSSGNLMITCRRPGSERWRVAKELHILASGGIVHADKVEEEALKRRKAINPNASEAIPIAIATTTESELLPRRHSDRPDLYNNDQLPKRKSQNDAEEEKEKERANEIYFKYGAMPIANRTAASDHLTIDTSTDVPGTTDSSLEAYVRKYSDFGVSNYLTSPSAAGSKSRSTSYSNLSSSMSNHNSSIIMALNPHTSSLSFIEYTPSKMNRKTMSDNSGPVSEGIEGTVSTDDANDSEIVEGEGEDDSSKKTVSEDASTKSHQTVMSYEEFLSRLENEPNAADSNKEGGKKSRKSPNSKTPPRPANQPPSIFPPVTNGGPPMLSIKHPSTLIDADDTCNTSRASIGGGVAGSASSQSFLFPNDKEFLMDGQDTPVQFKTRAGSKSGKSSSNPSKVTTTETSTATTATSSSTSSTKSNGKSSNSAVPKLNMATLESSSKTTSSSKKELILDGKEYKRRIAFDTSNLTPRSGVAAGQSKDDDSATPRQSSSKLMVNREELLPRRHTFNTVTDRLDDDFEPVSNTTVGGTTTATSDQPSANGTGSNQSTPSRPNKTRSWTFSRVISFFGFGSSGDGADSAADSSATGGDSSSNSGVIANTSSRSAKRGSGVSSREGSRHDTQDLPVILPSNAPQSVLLEASEKVGDRVKR